MATAQPRPRSSTSGSTTGHRQRPISRASTTSLHTNAGEAQSQAYHNVFQVLPAQPQQLNELNRPPFTSEDLMPRQEGYFPNASHGYDPALQYQNPRGMSVDVAPAMDRDMLRPSIHSYHSYNGKENVDLAPTDENKLNMGDSGNGQKKLGKGSSSTQANDQELRRLYRENCHRDLKDVAASVLANERGPKSEKTKQVFAMNWLSSVCKKASTSVPRNRVYSNYAQRCGTERVPLLNPASFGKLVRIIFPDIQTRRLGMRGESKYHYVDLALIEDEGTDRRAETVDANGPGSIPVAMPAFSKSQGPADVADFPSPIAPVETNITKAKIESHKEAAGYLYLNRRPSMLRDGPSHSNMISRQLKFPTYSENEFPDDAPIELPDLQAFLPLGTDVDAANALKALYRSHCISVIDCVRYCKEKPFWHHFTSFHGTLTVPVQKLFAHPNLAPWIQECDWLMYQKMIQFVSPLALQVVPDPVTAVFQSISDNLGQHILDVFQHHAAHVQDAKHGPAVLFAGLLGRLLRVNAASHAAAHILGNDATRDQMWHDWVYHVKPSLVVETCLPGIGYSRTIQILTSDIRDLLSPVSMTSYPGMQEIYALPASEAASGVPRLNELDDSSTSSVLDRWINFLHTLPSRFPDADARTLLHCVSDIGTAALRDITMATAVSFGQWTVTKVWVDEMMQWLAEKGGFLENGPSSTQMRPPKRTATEAELDSSHDTAAKRQYVATQSGNEQPEQQTTANFVQSASHTITIDGPKSTANTLPMPQRTSGAEVHVSHPPMGNFSTHKHPQPNIRSIHPPVRPRQPVTAGIRRQHAQASYQASQTPKRVSINHAGKDVELDTHDDSGIGLDLELPNQEPTPMRITDYNGFITNSTNSDPADVVVC